MFYFFILVNEARVAGSYEQPMWVLGTEFGATKSVFSLKHWVNLDLFQTIFYVAQASHKKKQKNKQKNPLYWYEPPKF